MPRTHNDGCYKQHRTKDSDDDWKDQPWPLDPDETNATVSDSVDGLDVIVICYWSPEAVKN